MKHHWKPVAIEKGVTVDRCLLCNCLRFTQTSTSGKHFTSYLLNHASERLRSSPVCVDKVNPEIPFA